MSQDGDDLFGRGKPERYRSAVDGPTVRPPNGPGALQHPQVDRPVQDHIGTALRGMYDELLAEPVPEHFADLIRRLQ